VNAGGLGSPSAAPPPVAAILFDALGTLLKLEPPAPRLQAEASRRFGVSLGELEARRAIAAEIAFYRRHLAEGRDRRSLEDLRVRCAAALREALPAPIRRELPGAEVLVEALLASLNFTAYPEVPAALGRYRAGGLRLVVVSNWDVSLHDVLRTLGLSPLLDGVLTAAEAGVRKPAAAIFEQALRLAGVSAREAVHVGDSVEEDVAGARAAGVEPILLSRSGTAAAPGVTTITNLAQPIPRVGGDPVGRGEGRR
jgi:putative hydrolase of the HAD superfamily